MQLNNYKPYTLVGPPAFRLVLDPLAVIFLDNRLYMKQLGLTYWLTNLSELFQFGLARVVSAFSDYKMCDN